MAPKRRRASNDNDTAPGDPAATQDTVPPAAPAAPSSAAAAAPADDRRAQMASIARRRAAHFANFVDSDNEEGGNVHVGSNEARNLGPWSSAAQLIEARQQASEARQGKLAAAACTGTLNGAEGIAWVPSRDVSLGPRPVDAVKPLFQSCLDLLVEYIESVESLWGLPDVVKGPLAVAICVRRKMSPQVACLFADAASGELALPDCTQLDAAAMIELVKGFAGPRLERLELGHCGRGFGDEVAAAAVRSGPLAALQRLALGGAYRLTDAGVLALLGAAPALSSLSLPQAPLVTGAMLEELPTCVPQLQELHLQDCRAVPGDALARCLPQLACLRAVSLDGMQEEVDDSVLAALATAPSLEDVSLRACRAISDAGIAALAAGRPQLRSLAVDECGKVTDASMRAVAGACRGLAALSVRRCAKLADEALAQVAARGCLRSLCASGVPNVGDATMAALARHCGSTLETLDVSFCRLVSDDALGHVVDACQALKTLVLYGCSQVTPRFVHGHSSAALKRVEGLGPGQGMPVQPL